MARSNNYPNLAVTLDDYAERLGIECPPFGGFTVLGEPNYFCRYVWSQTQREYLAMALQTAQELIEEQLGYPIAPRYFAEELPFGHYTKRGVEIPAPLGLARGMGIEFGVEVEAEIADAAVIAYSGDEGAVTVTVPAEVPLSELVIFYPDEFTAPDEVKHKYRVTPSLLERAAPPAETQVTITIPKCRLMKPALFYSNETVRYDDAANFMPTVAVSWVHTDNSQIATIYYDSRCAGPACAQGIQTACGEWRDKRLGLVKLTRAVYDADEGMWVKCCGSSCGVPRYAIISYRAGLVTTSATLTQAVIRLAHTLLPDEPCGCAGVIKIWEQDRAEAAVVAGIRNIPWGLTTGAYFAWGLVQQMRLGHGGLL